MHKNILTVIGITILFLGLSITPSVAVDTVKKTTFPVSNGTTLYVGGSGPGNYTFIQSAINDALDGDTVFVYNGTYHVRVSYDKGLVVDKSIKLIGEDKNNTIINGSGCEDIIKVTANNTNISRFTVIDGRTGIDGWYINNVTISMMNFIQTSRGIILIIRGWGSSFHTIKSCVFKGNNEAIWINGGTNIISGNIFENPIFGIDMMGSNNIITGNKFINYNSNDFEHLSITYTHGSTICDNTFINSQEKYGIAIEFDHGTSKNIISNNTISGYDKGIFMEWDNRFNKIVNNNISNNIWGILIMQDCNFNKVISNNFINNKHHAYFYNTIFTKWFRNYWGVSRILPIKIFGEIKIGPIEIPWINFDWHPAKEPYDI